MREMSCKNLEYLGIELDQDKNAIRSKGIREIQTKNSKVKILVVPTNEEIEIARQSYALLKTDN
jgi:acetate kinase